MFGIVKKEEDSSMSEPLILRPNAQFAEEVELADTEDLVREIISSIAETETLSKGPGYAPNAYFLQENEHLCLTTNGYVNANSYIASSSYNTSSPLLSVSGNGQVTGIQNANFSIADEVDTTVLSDDRTFQIEYISFPETVLKVQRRHGKESHQRLRADDAKVQLGIKMHGLAQVCDIKVYVARVNDPSFPLSNRLEGPVLVESQSLQESIGKYRVNVNLDSIYEIDGKKVYALAKNKTEEVNLFYLNIMVVFIDGTTSEASTKQFKIVGKAKDAVKNGKGAMEEEVSIEEPSFLPPPAVPGIKRARTETDESNNSSSLSVPNSYSYPDSHASPGSTSGYGSPSLLDDGLIKASRIAANYLEAKNADIGSLIVAEPIKTERGDIAYHFILKNPDDHPQFEEGEVVGLFVNEKGVRVLDKLTQKNALDAVLKGIISRSQYLEAHVQPEGVRTETICMFGIVPVRVKGPVKQGEILYASLKSPGMAVGSSNRGVTPLLGNDAAAIGVSWESISAHENEINLVQCLASVTMEIFQGMIERRVKSLKRDVKHDIDNIKKDRKRAKRKRIVCGVSVLVFVVSLSVLLWQIFMPMSALRLWLCSKGSIENSSASFQYVPLSSIYDLVSVKGEEFSFNGLKKKSGENIHPINGTGFHYYYNVRVCANGGKSTGDPVLKKHSIGGPTLFAVDVHCQKAYFYNGVSNRWCKYKSAINIKCTFTSARPIKTIHGDSGPGIC